MHVLVLDLVRSYAQPGRPQRRSFSAQVGNDQEYKIQQFIEYSLQLYSEVGGLLQCPGWQ
jgi:hypothetical protein